MTADKVLPQGFELSVEKKPIAITEIIFHKRPHLDEVAGEQLLRRYGESLFPGVKTAKLSFVEGEIVETETELDAAGKLPVGLGRECRFNEHRDNEDDETERLSEECAATLVAKYLKITENPELKRLLDDILFCDSKAECSPTMIAEVIKVDNRRRSGNTTEVITWAKIALDAIIEFEPHAKDEKPNGKSLSYFYKKWADDRGIQNDNIAKRLDTNIRQSEARKGERVIELAHIVDALMAVRGDTPETEEFISDWLLYAFEAMVIDQMDFWKQVRQARNTECIGVAAEINGEDCVLRLMVIESDSQNAQKAARYVGCDVALIRSSSGNVQIFTNGKKEGIDLTSVVRMIRIAECYFRFSGIWKLWPEFSCAGTHRVVKKWYYFKKAQMLFNGSSTVEKAPTRLSTQFLVYVLCNGFHPTLTTQWCKPESAEKWRLHLPYLRRMKRR